MHVYDLQLHCDAMKVLMRHVTRAWSPHKWNDLRQKGAGPHLERGCQAMMMHLAAQHQPRAALVCGPHGQ